jgi:hypothetical protein
MGTGRKANRLSFFRKFFQIGDNEIEKSLTTNSQHFGCHWFMGQQTAVCYVCRLLKVSSTGQQSANSIASMEG